MLPNPILLVTSIVLPCLVACEAGSRPTPTGGTPPASAAAADSSAAPASRATIKIDEAHDSMKNGAPYSIAPSTELVLDGGGHVFANLDAAGFGQPNSVHVVHGP